MVYQCRILNDKGQLKKIISPKEIQAKSDKSFFSQKSTQKAKKNISKFKESGNSSRQIFFHDKICVFCNKEFHPRHHSTKYCSHECQRNYYLNKKQIL